MDSHSVEFADPKKDHKSIWVRFMLEICSWKGLLGLLIRKYCARNCSTYLITLIQPFCVECRTKFISLHHQGPLSITRLKLFWNCFKCKRRHDRAMTAESGFPVGPISIDINVKMLQAVKLLKLVFPKRFLPCFLHVKALLGFIYITTHLAPSLLEAAQMNLFSQIFAFSIRSCSKAHKSFNRSVCLPGSFDWLI